MARQWCVLGAMAICVSLSIAAAPAHGDMIRAFAEVRQFEFNPGGIIGADGVASSSNDSSRISEQAVVGPGFAGYDIFPREGDSAMAGLSKTVAFGDFALFRNESDAEAFVEFQDTLHITGPIHGLI